MLHAGKTNRVFIAYAADDQDRIGLLSRRLQEDGFLPWIEGMRDFPRADTRGLAMREMKRSLALLVCLSASAVTSDGAIHPDISSVLQLWRENLVSTVRLLTVRLDRSRLPSAFRGLPTFDLFKRGGFGDLCHALKATDQGSRQINRTATVVGHPQEVRDVFVSQRDREHVLQDLQTRVTSSQWGLHSLAASLSTVFEAQSAVAYVQHGAGQWRIVSAVGVDTPALYDTTAISELCPDATLLTGATNYRDYGRSGAGKGAHNFPRYGAWVPMVHDGNLLAIGAVFRNERRGPFRTVHLSDWSRAFASQFAAKIWAKGVRGAPLLPAKGDLRDLLGLPGRFKQGWALCIGVAGYPLAAPLPDVVLNDARKIAELLQSPGCGYPAGQVKLLLDQDATTNGIREGFRWLAKRVKATDTVVVFFSGHGGRLLVPSGQVSCILPYDYDPANMLKTTLSAQEIAKGLRDMRAARVFAIFDSCFAGGIGLKTPKAPFDLKGGFTDQTYAQLAQGQGRAVLAAARADQPAQCHGHPRYSPFTACCVEGLLGYGAKADDEFIGVTDITSYVSRRIKKFNTQQVPYFHAQADNFPIALCRGGKGDDSGRGSRGDSDDRGPRDPVQDTHLERSGGADAPAKVVRRIVVSIDMVGFADVQSRLQDSIGPRAVDELMKQIQGFIDVGIKAARVKRLLTVVANTGDGAILQFAKSARALAFAEAVHGACRKRNAKYGDSMSQRHFRIGAATGEVLLHRQSDGSYTAGGEVISQAVRIEAGARPDEFIVDEATFNGLPEQQQARFGPFEELRGKRNEVFRVARLSFASPPSPSSQGTDGRQRKLRSVLELFRKLNDNMDSLTEVIFLLDRLPKAKHPSGSPSFNDWRAVILKWAAIDEANLNDILEALLYACGSSQPKPP